MIPRFPVSWRIAAGLAATFLLAAGCKSPTPPSAQVSPKPNFGPPMQDVRTEIAIQQAEMEYNAAKNSRPTHQYEAERQAAKKAEEKKKQEAEAAKKAAAPKS